MAKALADNASIKKLRIEAHTDNAGDAGYNKALSERRAKWMREYLIRKGINSKRLDSAGFGITKPIDTNDTPEGRANNPERHGNPLRAIGGKHRRIPRADVRAGHARAVGRGGAGGLVRGGQFARGLAFERAMVEMLRTDAALSRAQRLFLKDINHLAGPHSTSAARFEVLFQ